MKTADLLYSMICAKYMSPMTLKMTGSEYQGCSIGLINRTYFYFGSKLSI